MVALDQYEAPHLKLKYGSIYPHVLVVGDPFRTEAIAKLCDSHTQLSWNREYRVFNAVYHGVNLTIASHGIGGPGAAICFEELIKLGAKVIIRLGTCGSLKPNVISQGDIVVSVASAREDGLTQYLVPPGYPAVADPGLVMLLHKALSDGSTDKKTFCGITLTHALFYPGPSSNTISLKQYSDSVCLSVEMEVSTLYAIASVKGVRAAACAVIDGSPFEWDSGNYDPHSTKVDEAKRRMFLAGLETLASLGIIVD
jgi:uridine phosphorylase